MWGRCGVDLSHGVRCAPAPGARRSAARRPGRPEGRIRGAAEVRRIGGGASWGIVAPRARTSGGGDATSGGRGDDRSRQAGAARARGRSESVRKSPRRTTASAPHAAMYSRRRAGADKVADRQVLERPSTSPRARASARRMAQRCRCAASRWRSRRETARRRWASAGPRTIRCAARTHRPSRCSPTRRALPGLHAISPSSTPRRRTRRATSRETPRIRPTRASDSGSDLSAAWM